MQRKLLIIIGLLATGLSLFAASTEGKEAPEKSLSQIDSMIVHWQQKGNIGKEGEARWQKIVALKNSSLTGELFVESEPQMEWFKKHRQWDNYYRTWQLKANSLSAQGKLQQSLQETQRMLNDAKERNNKLGRAMAYKQIGVIYLNMKQTEAAVEALQHYAELMGKDGDINSLSNIYYRMAKAYDYDKAYDQELRVTNDWYQFLEARVGKQKVPEVRECYHAFYLAKAASYIGLKRFEDAKMALDTAGHHAHIINTPLSLHHYYKMQARYFLAKGDAGNALLFTDSVSMTTTEKDDHIEEIKAQALILLGESAEAAKIYQRLYHEKDSVFSHDARQHLDELNTLFQVDELKTEQQHARFKYMLITTSSIVLTLLVLLFYGLFNVIRQKRANERLRIANERAQESSKMKSDFIRNISHEIRTPLNIVSGFTQVLATPGMDLPEDLKKDYQQKITENTDRITNLVDRMLELTDASSEAQIERNDNISARNLASNAIDHSKVLNAKSAVKFDFPDSQEADSITLLTNKLYAVRALTQLLENAVKFTHEGSITLRMDSTESKVRFIVEDTGIGIPADQAEHIFEEFVQLDEFVDGTGIGLTVARSIAQRMGGNLWLDTSYTGGARFVFELLRN